MRLTVSRDGLPYEPNTTGNEESQSILVQLNLNDNRFDRPVFDRTVYEFTVDENIQLGTEIGQLNAVYMHRPGSVPTPTPSTTAIRYRIVPFVEDNPNQDPMLILNGVFSPDETASTSGLPVRIDPDSGRLTVRLNIDREKFVMNAAARRSDSTRLGLIKFNVEASYDSISYSYAKVTIYKLLDLNHELNSNSVFEIGKHIYP